MTEEPRHAAPSPSGSYRPPLGTGSEPMTTPMPRVRAQAPTQRSASPSSWFDPASRHAAPHPGAADPSLAWPAGSDSGPNGLRRRQPRGGLAGTGPSMAGLAHAAPAGAGPAGNSSAQPAPQDAGRHEAGPAQARQARDDQWRAEPAAAGRHAAAGGPAALRLIWIYPDLLSTYGDRGNLLTLIRRARLRGIAVEAVEVNADQPVPRQGDIYLLGGGEDMPQILAASRLRADGGLRDVAARGAVIFAVCAGYQLVGEVFGGVQGEPVAGLGIIDIRSGRGQRRGVGEVVADVDPALGVERLTGFENHQGVTALGGGARPLARVMLGVGNGDGTEGAYAGHVLGTYLHGPALVRNPGLADLLLSWVTGPLPPLGEADERLARQLRAERLAAIAG